VAAEEEELSRLEPILSLINDQAKYQEFSELRQSQLAEYGITPKILCASLQDAKVPAVASNAEMTQCLDVP
jgi:hypothetical protein